MNDSLSFDEKFITNIFQKYLKAKIILQKISLSALEEKQVQYGKDYQEESQLDDYQNHLQIVETILALLPKAEYTCLVKDFLNAESTNDDSIKFWWKEYYSQQSYNKLRLKAINHFLYLFLI